MDEVLSAVVAEQRFALVLLGVFAAIALTLALVGIYGVEPQGVATFTTVLAVFVVVALLACWIPAGRAAGVDSVEALRYE